MKPLRYFIKIFDALSQLLNVILFNGESNHSISGDAYRYERKKLEAVINFIFSPIEKNHCKYAYYSDVHRASELIREFEQRELNHEKVNTTNSNTQKS